MLTPFAFTYFHCFLVFLKWNLNDFVIADFKIIDGHIISSRTGHVSIILNTDSERLAPPTWELEAGPVPHPCGTRGWKGFGGGKPLNRTAGGCGGGSEGWPECGCGICLSSLPLFTSAENRPAALPEPLHGAAELRGGAVDTPFSPFPGPLLPRTHLLL